VANNVLEQFALPASIARADFLKFLDNFISRRKSKFLLACAAVSRKSACVETLLTVVLMAICLPTSTAAEPTTIRSHIRREPLASTAVATAGYSKRLHIMEIEFYNGAIYRYLDVPPTVYHEFLSAESKTQYYDWNIKGRYRSLRLRGTANGS